jgi:ESCRT-I complex subunit VPS28
MSIVHNFLSYAHDFILFFVILDEIQPLISDLNGSLAKLHNLSADFPGLLKMRAWLEQLNKLRAVDELGETESRQLLFDLESSYAAFHQHLRSH